ncbi:PREDICTED: uncharacterized protein LOC105976406 [Erythranthe guttata]|uniref:uncharacterized protein LOC105976406 n=1 Tax=Erythranthe guttata TaxID=4155 RepID=UPI00064D73AD|nr:PREDICTED: uncharacterized protein LOC105976406 [Erythranthe guttata]|eukprot:XP_012857132.1 PREDICTED: uncharacterized protein LOC105976406 [Erythranthe guttata]
MVRLVFRPYTQVRRTICTSVSLRASTRVSSGFAPLRHSSPSFGSRQPVDSHTCQTPWSVFQDGSNGEPACQHRERAVAEARRGRALSATIGATASTGISTARALAAASIRTGPRLESIGGPAFTVPHPTEAHRRPPSASLPTIQALFDSLFKVLFIFPSRYLFAIGLSPVFSLGRNLPPDWGCIPKQPDSPTAPRGATGSGHNGALTLSGAPFQGTWARSAAEDASPDYNSDDGAVRFSSWAIPGSLAVTRGILVSFFSSAY